MDDEVYVAGFIATINRLLRRTLLRSVILFNKSEINSFVFLAFLCVFA